MNIWFGPQQTQKENVDASTAFKLYSLDINFQLRNSSARQKLGGHTGPSGIILYLHHFLAPPPPTADPYLAQWTIGLANRADFI